MSDPHISSNTLVFRAIRKSKWIVEGEVQFTAFVLNSNKNELDLSLFTENKCTQNLCVSQLSKCYGEIILKAEGFTKAKANIEILQTPLADIPSHVSVYGLPPFYDTEEERLESEARNIAEEILKSVIKVESRKFDLAKIKRNV